MLPRTAMLMVISLHISHPSFLRFFLRPSHSFFISASPPPPLFICRLIRSMAARGEIPTRNACVVCSLVLSRFYVCACLCEWVSSSGGAIVRLLLRRGCSDAYSTATFVDAIICVKPRRRAGLHRRVTS
eukprot:GHVU01170436.1.p2 GENE.GHVU01170436.1~~GHVU01170436.1.p2  ORF type:complete len:129 (-),score=0.94 GHVU01170436.1:103-489(-)